MHVKRALLVVGVIGSAAGKLVPESQPVDAQLAKLAKAIDEAGKTLSSHSAKEADGEHVTTQAAYCDGYAVRKSRLFPHPVQAQHVRADVATVRLASRPSATRRSAETPRRVVAQETTSHARAACATQNTPTSVSHRPDLVSNAPVLAVSVARPQAQLRTRRAVAGFGGLTGLWAAGHTECPVTLLLCCF